MIALALSPVWSGCYRTVSTSTGIQEDVTRREIQPQAGRVDVDASLAAPTAVDLAAAERKMCRTRIFGTATPYKETTKLKDAARTKSVAQGFAGAGAGAALIGVLVMALADSEEPNPTASPEEKARDEQSAADDRKFAAVAMGAGVGLALTGLIVWLAPPERRTSRDLGDPRPLDRFDGDPFVCENSTPALLASFPVRANVAFADSKSTLDLRATTGKDGRARLDLEPALLTATHCGAATVSATAADGARLPAGAALGPGAKLQLDLPAGPRASLADLAQRDPSAVAVASLCCTRRAIDASQDDCEERCARAGMVDKCLFARRACLLKTERAEDEPEKARGLCRTLYEECLVGKGTSSRNLKQCIDGCAAQRATEVCR